MDKGHVLIVDDEREILTSLENVLHDEGYRVARAESGEVALQLLRTETPDVVLLDVWMPGIDGIKTLQTVKESSADTEVVVMSGHGNIETAVAATKLGAFDFIEKPLSLDTVLRVVDSAVQTKREKEHTTGAGVEAMLEGGGREAQRTRKAIRRAMRDSGPTLVAGERGTGKRFVVRMMHMNGAAKERGFVPLHCRSLPPLSEKSEWAKALAHLVPASFRGTVYLDGLEGLPASEREECIGRLVGHTSGSMRLIASLNHAGTPEEEASARLLCEKTGASLIHLPPLRERKGDVLLLANKFLDECAESAGEEKEFSEDAIALLEEYDWPGNVAELKGVVAKAAYSSRGREVRVEHFPDAMRAASSPRPEGEAILRPQPKAEEGKTSARAAATPGRASQRSIARSVVLHGRGLHSGLKTGLIVEPLPPGSGVRFGSLTSSETVRARVDFVAGTNHATNLRNGAVMARTIEHLMSALHAYRISNILVKIGEEVPVMDGSAVEFCRLLEEAGIEEQGEKIEELRLDAAYEVGEPGAREGYIRIEPADSLSISYLMDYPEPIGRQHYLYAHEDAAGFRKEIAPARTFGLVSELKSLESMGLAEGGRWDNVILVDGERVLNTELRFPDEFVRHKILDVMGDLYLLGRPVLGRVIAERSGHRHNVALVRKLVEAQG